MASHLRCIAGTMLIAAALALAACGGDESAATGAVVDGPMKVLVYSRTTGFRHPSIEPGRLAVQQLGQENGFTVVATEDPTAFTAQNLAQFDVVMFLNTTADVLDGVQEAAFEDWVQSGGGFVGVHSAADTEYDWDFYETLVGARFLAHPVANQPGTLRVEDPDHPGTAHLDDPWTLPLEEFYSFKTNPRGAVRVLLSIDESSYLQEPNTSCDPRGPTFPEGYSGVMGDHPISWCHDHYAGRAWYTALGHEIYLYSLPEYRAHLLGGILVAGRRVAASCAVNEKPAAVPDYVAPVLEPCSGQVLP